MEMLSKTLLYLRIHNLLASFPFVRRVELLVFPANTLDFEFGFDKKLGSRSPMTIWTLEPTIRALGYKLRA